jgi:hypothetical protein
MVSAASLKTCLVPGLWALGALPDLLGKKCKPPWQTGSELARPFTTIFSFHVFIKSLSRHRIINPVQIVLEFLNSIAQETSLGFEEYLKAMFVGFVFPI